MSDSAVVVQPPPKPKPVKTSEYLRYDFSADEQKQNAKDLARKTQLLAELETRKKRLTADLKAETETAEAEVQKLSRWVNDENDYRMIDCEWHFHTPKNGMKSLIRMDTGEVAKEVFMSGQEMQEILPFDEEPLGEKTEGGDCASAPEAQ